MVAKCVKKESPKGKTGEEGNQTRRESARIKTKQRESKELLVRKRVELLDEDNGGSGRKTRANAFRRRVNVENVEDTLVEKKAVDEQENPCGVSASKNTAADNVAISASEKAVVPGAADKSAHAKVKDTIRLFNKHYLHFVQEEEKRCAKAKADKMAAKKSKTKKGKIAEAVDQKNSAKRPDLKAVSKMMELSEILYPEKMIGDLPGIAVGHQFYSRAEMVAVGFHSHWLNGIDFMGLKFQIKYRNYTFPLAVAIVISGMYEDDLDNAEDVIYTGQGGHNLVGNKRQIRDQELTRGNLALKNCVEHCVPVRVIRGHSCSTSYTGRIYTYDGLYKVVQYWAEKGLSGYTVFKYRLRRLEGQPILTTNQVHFTYGHVPASVSEIRGLVCADISEGQEDAPIPATNLVDDPPVAPTGFKYIKSIQFSKNVKLPATATGCNCEGSCMDPKTCACAKLNGSDFPYVHKNGGRLIEAKDVVFECGPNCGCGPGCVNRISQRGLQYRLEVFRTPKKGWAVRSWDFIPSGAPICEYVGVVMRTEDTDDVSQNNYLFDIDCVQTMRGLGGRERRSRDVSVPTLSNSDGPDVSVPTLSNSDGPDVSVPEFCIDALSKGNIARFINHSCEPNLFVQCVLTSHHDLKLAKVMLFAADNIPPLQELTYDYGYELDSVSGADGKVIKMACYCGAADCRKRLF